MVLAEEYKLSNRRFKEHYLRTMWLGWIPAGVALFIWNAQPSSVSPVVLGILGISVAMEMILWSGRAIHTTRDPITPVSQRLVARSDMWFPHFLIFIQGTTVALTGLLLWYTICKLGLRSNVPQHFALFMALVLYPLRRMFTYEVMTAPTQRKEMLRELVHYSQIIFITLFFALTMHMLAVPSGQLLTDTMPMGAIMVWIPAVLVMISCVILFIDHVVRKQQPESGPPPTQNQPPVDTF